MLSTGEALLDCELTTSTADHGERHWNVSFTPVMHADGSATGVIVSVVDVTERRALLEAERDARVRADFLARSGAILDASLDYEETLRSVVQIAIPEVADWCAVSVLDDSGVLQRWRPRTSTRPSASWARRSRAASRRTRPRAAAPTGWRARARRPTSARSPTRCSSAAVQDPEHLDLLRRLGLRSASSRR